MKKVINRKMYDTYTANELFEWESGHSYNAHWHAETLYRKKNGEFFLVCDGGALSPYGEHLTDGSRIAGKFIRPLSDEEALDWVAKRMDGEDVEALFPGVIQE